MRLNIVAVKSFLGPQLKLVGLMVAAVLGFTGLAVLKLMIDWIGI